MKILACSLWILFFLFEPKLTFGIQKYTVDFLYNHFEKTSSPKQLFIEAQKHAIWFSKECRKGKTRCDKALSEFNKPDSMFGTLSPLISYSEIVEMDTGMIKAHPNPLLHKLLNVPDLDKIFKDYNGLLVAMFYFQKLRKHGKWSWAQQFSTWIRSETKLKEPLYNLNIIIQVPGTTYQVHRQMPFRATSIEDIDAKIKKIEIASESWVLPEYIRLYLKPLLMQ